MLIMHGRCSFIDTRTSLQATVIPNWAKGLVEHSNVLRLPEPAPAGAEKYNNEVK